VSQQINLYNPLFLKQEKYFSARTMTQALGLIALGLLGLYAYALIESRTGEHAADQYRRQAAAQQEQAVALTTRLAGQGRSSALEADVGRLDAEVRGKRATLQALGTGELGNTDGFSDFLAAFARQAQPGVWLTGVDIADSGNELAVRGRALRPELVPAYLRALNNESMMRGRRVTEMRLTAKAGPAAVRGQMGEPERFVEFTLNAPLHPAATPAKAGTP
jgi:Tfp pilus assembly protein PilN